MGNEKVVERYLEKHYWQHFCGEVNFQYRLPFDPSDFVHFRHRIGKEGMEKIFKQILDLFGEDMIRKEVNVVRVDTTVQEKNISFPIDSRLYEKVIEHCKRIAIAKGVMLKCTYTQEIKKLRYQLRFARKPKNFNRLMRTQKKLLRIAIKIYSDLVTQLNPMPVKDFEQFNVLYRVLTQQLDDANKVYSIHDPEVICIAKGKEHKPYEFGNKSSFAYIRKTGMIVGAKAIKGNMFDGHTLSPQLEQVKGITHGKKRKAIVDRVYRGRQKIGMTEVVMPNTSRKESYYMKKQREAPCRSRASIEGLISHLNHNHRLLRNYLKGTVGDQINTLLAAAAYNMRKWMRIKREEILVFIFQRYYYTLSLVPANIKSI